MKVFKRILIAFSVFIAFLLVGITIFINSPYMKNMVSSFSSRFLKGNVQIGSLRLTPFSIRIKGVKWADNSETLLRLNYCAVNFNPFEIKRMKMRKVVVKGLFLNNPEHIKEHINLPERKEKGITIPPISINLLKMDSIYTDYKGHSTGGELEMNILTDSTGMNLSINKLSIKMDDNRIIKNIKGKISFRSINNINIDSLQISSLGGKIYINGEVKKKLNINATVSHLRLSQLSTFLKDTTIGGVLNMKATLKGTMNSPVVQGYIILTKPSFKNYSADKILIEPKLYGRDYAARINIDDALKGKIEGRIKGKAKGKIHLSNLDIKRFTGKRTNITGEITFLMNNNLDGRFSLSLKHSDYEGVKIRNLSLNGRKIEEKIFIDTLSLVGDPGKYNAKGWIKGKNLSFSILGSPVKLSFVNHFVPGLYLSGSGSLKFLVQGDIKNPYAEGNFGFNDIEIKGIKIEKVMVDANVKNIRKARFSMNIYGFSKGKTSVDSILMMANLSEDTVDFKVLTGIEKREITLKGNIHNAKPIFCNLDTILIKAKGEPDIRNIKPVKLTISRGEYILKDMSIVGPGFQILMNGSYGKDLDILLNISSTDLRKIAMYMGLKHILKGNLDIYVNVQGTKIHPIASIYGTIKDFQFDEAKFDSISILSDYNGKRLRLLGLNLVKDTIISHIDAEIPLNNNRIDRNAPFNFNTNVRFDNISWAMARWRSMMDVYRGEIKMNISGSGSINHPKLDGGINIKNVCLNIPSVNMKMEGFSGKIDISEKGMDINLNNGDKTIRVSGTLGMNGIKPGNMDIGIDLSGLHIKDMMNLEALLDGKLKYTGNIKHASLTGDINIYKVVANIPFQGRKKGTKPKQSPVDVDIKIHMPRNVWVRNELVDMELGGDIRFIKKQRMKMEGEMEVKGGYFYYFDKPFDVEEGKFVFVEDIIPNINLKARSTLTYRYTDEEGETKEIQGPVVLIVSGTLNNLQFDLYTESPLPPLTLQEIIPLLNLDMTWSELASFQRMSKTLPSKAVSFFLRTQLLNRIQNSLGIDALDLNANLFGEQKSTQITVGKYFTKNIYGSYTHDILSEYPDQFLLKYILKRGDILVQRDEYGRFWGGFEITFSK